MPKRKVVAPELSIPHKPRPVQPLSKTRTAKMILFARLWDGTIQGTLRRCRQDGVPITDDTASAYLRDHRFIDLMREQKNEAPGTGIWTLDELKRFYTRVAAGIEADGYTLLLLKEPIIPGEDDYDEVLGGAQFRTVERHVPRYPDMGDRIRASDLLGRSLGAFLDKVEVSGDLKISVVDLLDDDLKHAKPVIDVGSPVAQLVDIPAQVVDNSEETNELL